ncbi:MULTISPECIES: GspH/FimT family pseudopilin [unclassified Rhizobium]|uniref:GspH/FimT family pseudopilin n=1 Tax=unclassified Rhizobium TaxID=2613769 RepID=UPI001C83852A|nr:MULTISPECIES: GspH/FimT family pseudopilin [unclassified Rhizobium]MBX5230574.1 prepilin-type N-terminal cleavage/methylation domain-containing protein [Rhizobium sp. NLR9b]MBX5242728.1 prepilin-type N-terminal cleavage/methylation domain-containing protein [Rhizobium sp. NLR22b]MBX5291242.1 prepilin-type N-terminal cleavage/methylation domain-containing protein [Rhizobium sp. NLR10b]
MSARSSAHRHAGSAGFTLMEMLVVLAILGMVLAVALPQFHRAGSSTTATVASSIVRGARLARLVAIKRGSDTTLSIDTATRTVHFDIKHEDIVIPASMSMVATVGRNAATTASKGSIQFLADGSSSGGEIRLRTDKEKEIRVKISWLTGSATMVSDD